MNLKVYSLLGLFNEIKGRRNSPVQEEIPKSKQKKKRKINVRR